MVRNDGYEPELAGDGRAALQTHSARPHRVVLDVIPSGRLRSGQLTVLLAVRGRPNQQPTLDCPGGDEPQVTSALLAATAQVVAESAIAFVANQSPASGEPEQRMVAKPVAHC